LPERKRQELASAIRTAARALGRSPEIIPADGRLLASRLKEVAPAAIGISHGRWNNVRALLRTALALVQPISPGRHRNDLSPEWLALSNELGSRSDKIALSRALHFCSARGITPNAVTEGTFDEYRLHLDRSLLKRPNETFALTVRAWRRAEEAIEGWPKIAVSIPDRRKYWVSGWGRFPEPLRRDCQAWCDRLAGHDLLEDAPFRPVRPATLAHREWQIRFASALVRMNRDPSALTSLRNLIEIDAFKTGLRFFLDREGGAPTTAIADLASSLKAIARHHVRVEPHHLDQMGSIIRRLAPGRRGLTEANRTRLRPFDDRGNILALLKLPGELMRQARRHRNLQRGAVRAQLAVAIEILLMAPVRMSNLVPCFRNNVPMASGCIIDFVPPGVDDWLAIDVADEGHQAFPEFVVSSGPPTCSSTTSIGRRPLDTRPLISEIFAGITLSARSAKNRRPALAPPNAVTVTLGWSAAKPSLKVSAKNTRNGGQRSACASSRRVRNTGSTVASAHPTVSPARISWVNRALRALWRRFSRAAQERHLTGCKRTDFLQPHGRVARKGREPVAHRSPGKTS
jgi:hypothetical protein